MVSSRRVGVYPGSFNPPTVAHLAIAEAARAQHQLDAVVWMVSVTTLAKEHVQTPPLEERLAVLGAVAASHSWLEVAMTERQLLVDIADGFDLLIMGADKWHQIQDPVWYGGTEAERDAALALLPPVAVAPRPPLEVPEALLLDLDPAHAEVSSTAAREGAVHHMAPAARDHAHRTGTWILP